MDISNNYAFNLSYDYLIYYQDDIMYWNKIFYNFISSRVKNNEIFNAKQILKDSLNYKLLMTEHDTKIQQQLFTSFFFEYKELEISNYSLYINDYTTILWYKWTVINYIYLIDLPNITYDKRYFIIYDEKQFSDHYWFIHENFLRIKYDMQVDNKEKIYKYNLYFYTFENPINVSTFYSYNNIFVKLKPLLSVKVNKTKKKIKKIYTFFFKFVCV